MGVHTAEEDPVSKVLAVLLVASLASFALVLPRIEEIDYLIGELEYGMEIHEYYLENDYHREYTGTREWHERWIDTYNRTINVLQSYRQVLGLFKMEGLRLR